MCLKAVGILGLSPGRMSRDLQWDDGDAWRRIVVVGCSGNWARVALDLADCSLLAGWRI